MGMIYGDEAFYKGRTAAAEVASDARAAFVNDDPDGFYESTMPTPTPFPYIPPQTTPWPPPVLRTPPPIAARVGGAGVVNDPIYTDPAAPTNGHRGNIPRAELTQAATVISAALILSRVSGLIRPAFSRFFGGFARGTVLRWNSLPAWVRTTLATLGILEGADIILDIGEGVTGIPLPDPGLLPGNGIGGIDLWPFGQPIGNGSTVSIPDGSGKERVYQVASAWEANNVWFYRFTSGHLGVINKHGVWKVWKPRKPTVLYSSGNDLDDVIKADKIIQKATGEIKQVLTRRGWAVKRKTSG